MDIHRCRFVPYRPQSINTLAFSHRSVPKQKPPKDLRLALGRENGDVEIWNPASGNWVQEKILRGSRDRTIEQLVWTQDLLVDEENTSNTFDEGPLRLFSTGGSPSITEWNFATGQQKRHAEGNAADIWCFAAQPQWKRSGKEPELSKIAAEPSQLLAAGCSNGSVILFTTADDSLQYFRMLNAAPKKNTKVISITWRDRDTVVAGYEDGNIRVIDVPTRSTTRTMSLGKSMDGSTPVVWTLKCLPNGTILSGDSSGELKIWDAKTLSLSQRLKAHDADILDIATSVSGDLVFTAGVDRRIVQFKQVPLQIGKRREVWQKLKHRRFHQHDVKALASFEAKGMSVMVSGGIDPVPIVMPLRNWEKEHHRSLSHLPQNPQMSCSSKARLMLTWWDRDLLIWRLPKTPSLDSMDYAASEGANHQLLARLELKDDENITSAQISEDGRMVVAATAAGVKLFQIRERVEAEDIKIRTRLLDLPTSVRSFGASTVGFSPNSKWLFTVRASGLVVMIKIIPGALSKDMPQFHHQVVKLGRKQRQIDRKQSTKLGSYPQAINCVSFSSDSRIIATGDLSGTIETWVLEGHEDLQEAVNDDSVSSSNSSSDSDPDSDSDDESDSRVIHGQKWIRISSGSSLPKLDSAILVLSFKPHPSSFQNTDLGVGLHATRHNPHPVSHELPSSNTMLIAITASHQIIEFDIMSSQLSDWSRRNPSSCLPRSFTQIKDRVMGIFWDCNTTVVRERLWLYGPTWLFMLDMTCDLNIVDAQDKIGQIGDYDVREPLPGSAVVKRTAEDQAGLPLKKRRKRNTGAGDEKRHATLVSSTVYNKADAMDIETGLLSPTSDTEDEDEDIETETTGALSQLRRGTNPVSAQDLNDLQANDLLPNPDTSNSQYQSQSPIHHTIYRYRSIFGIAALQPQIQNQPNKNKNEPDTVEANTITSGDQAMLKPNTDATRTTQNLEIILVERPMYDVELLQRFDGGQDWST